MRLLLFGGNNLVELHKLQTKAILVHLGYNCSGVHTPIILPPYICNGQTLVLYMIIVLGLAITKIYDISF